MGRGDEGWESEMRDEGAAGREGGGRLGRGGGMY